GWRARRQRNATRWPSLARWPRGFRANDGTRCPSRPESREFELSQQQEPEDGSGDPALEVRDLTPGPIGKFAPRPGARLLDRRRHAQEADEPLDRNQGGQSGQERDQPPPPVRAGAG